MNDKLIRLPVYVLSVCLLLNCGGGDSVEVIQHPPGTELPDTAEDNEPPPEEGPEPTEEIADDENTAPVFTSSAFTSVAERNTDSFYTAIATDQNNDPLSFSISGADASFFTIDASSGELAFREAADFETPLDLGGDNVYELVIEVSDGVEASSLSLSVTVTDITDVPLRVTRIASGLDRPIFVTGAGDGSERLFVVEQRGLIRIIDLTNNTLLPSPFLDISSSVSCGNEQGLLGLAFAPDFSSSGLFYVYITNLSGDTEVLEYTVSAADNDVADVGSRRMILNFAQPFANHNAGWLGFGPDGFLYIASGDGGGAGDPQNNAQTTANLLGTILRIDPSDDDFPQDGNANYAIPAGNPFVGQAGADEIWAYGLRNPFRASFDRATGDLYIGDVGQGELEEIDLLPAGESGLNFGWNILEGTRTFLGGNTPSFTPPVAEYPHDNSAFGGFSVTGGYVHRGSVEALFGQYVFADFVSNNVWSLPVNELAQGATIAATDFTLQTPALTVPDEGTINNISSFGEDDDGELYLVELFGGQVFRVENDE